MLYGCTVRPAPALRRFVVTVAGALAMAACRDSVTRPTDEAARGREPDADAPRYTVVLDSTPTSCGTDCVWVADDVPGTYRRPLATGPDPYTAGHSVPWPDTLTTTTVMLLRVAGVIPRAYVSAMTPSFAYLQGTPYKAIDADGAFSGSYCYGEIRTDFRVFGFREYTLRSCTLSSSNNDANSAVVAEKAVVGRLKGSGVMLRTGMLQPSWPGWFNCLNGPCVIAADARQTITMHPWMDKLRLAASPTEVYEGDSVTFTPTVSGGMTMLTGSQRWIWVPHWRVVGGQRQTDPPDRQTGVCANGVTNCTVRVYRTGNMYLKANLNPGPVTEQAFAKVVVKPLQLLAVPTPTSVISTLDSVTVQVRTVPERALSSITIAEGSGLSALRLGSVSSTFTSSCDPGTGICTLAGGSAPVALVVTAVTEQGVTLTTTVEVQQVNCPTGDPVLDNQAVRNLLKQLIRLGLAGGREYAGVVVRDRNTGIESFLIDSISSGTCTSSSFNQSIPANLEALHIAHFHPTATGDTVPCRKNTIAGTFRGALPSPTDWDASQLLTTRSVLVDPAKMASFGAGPIVFTDSVVVGKDPSGKKVYKKVPTLQQIPNMYNEVSRSGPGCVRP